MNKRNKWAASNNAASPHAKQAKELYPTPTEATLGLLGVERFRGAVWEPACGLGHISKVFAGRGFDVVSTDKFADEHGYGEPGDFLETTATRAPNIITNPPYSLLRPFMTHALVALPGVQKVALFIPFGAIEIRKNVAIWREHGFPLVHLMLPAFDIDCGPPRGVIRSVFHHAWAVWEQGVRRDCIELRHVDWKDHAKTGTEDLI